MIGLLQREQVALGAEGAVLDFYGESALAGPEPCDFFEFMPAPSNGLGLVCADVFSTTRTGRALLLSCLRAHLRDHLPWAGADLRHVVQELNRAICEIAPENSYVSCFCAAIDSARHELHYVNAGHEPALLLRNDGRRVNRLEITGTILGLTARAAYQRRSLPLEPGDLLAIFSDGITEAADPNGLVFGDEGVRQALQKESNARCDRLTDRVLHSVNRFADATVPADDRTIAVVRFGRTAPAPLFEEEAAMAFSA